MYETYYWIIQHSWSVTGIQATMNDNLISLRVPLGVWGSSVFSDPHMIHWTPIDPVRAMAKLLGFAEAVSLSLSLKFDNGKSVISVGRSFASEQFLLCKLDYQMLIYSTLTYQLFGDGVWRCCIFGRLKITRSYIAKLTHEVHLRLFFVEAGEVGIIYIWIYLACISMWYFLRTLLVVLGFNFRSAHRSGYCWQRPGDVWIFRAAVMAPQPGVPVIWALRNPCRMSLNQDDCYV